MHRTRQEVIRQIRDAFHGVTLGNGIGLLEGRALDDYAEPATRRACRHKDERKHWEEISKEALVFYADTLSFLDAEGMRFHLPAFLIAELEGASVSCIFHLVKPDDLGQSQFALLSDAQRAAVREFLLFVVDDPDYDFHRRKIRKALGERWKDAKSHY